MSDHEVSRRIAAEPQRVFDLVADAERLPEWLPTVQHVTEHDGMIELEGEAGPDQHAYGDGGFWRPSPDQRRVEWSTPSRGGNPSAYSGWVQVGDSAGGSEVVAHLTFEDESHRPPDVESSLSQSLETLEHLLVES